MISKADISLVRSLADKKAREEHGLFVVEGRKLVGEALSSGLRVVRVFGTEEFAGVPGCEAAGRKEIERISSLRTPQGVVALVEIPRHPMPAKPGETLALALDGVQDPGNLGTILRIADWFGIADVFCSPDTADRFNPKAVQASMGAVLRVRAHYAPLAGILADAAACGTPVYGTFLDGTNLYGAAIPDPGRGIIVMGSEGGGISPGAAQSVTDRLHIPPYPAGNPAAESLNVASAAAIVCAEFRRRDEIRAKNSKGNP